MIAIELSIKNNEDMVLSLAECVNVLDTMKPRDRDSPSSDSWSGGSAHEERFTVEMFSSLERHVLLTLQFKLAVPTSLDFVLHFAHRAYSMTSAQELTLQCVPWLYFVSVNYEVGRGRKPSAVALASICHCIQTSSDQFGGLEKRDSLLEDFLHDRELIEETWDLVLIFSQELEQDFSSG